MPFTRPTLQEIVDRIDSDFQTRIDGASSILRRSILKVMSRVYAGAVHLLYGFLIFVADQLFVSSAEADYLEKHGSEWGVNRKAAAAAAGEVTITGTVGVTVPAGSELEAQDGQRYTVDEDAVIGAAGTGDAAVTAMVAGEDGNQDAGTTLSFTSPIVGVDSTATVDSNAIIGGVDEEEDEDLRNRILVRKRMPPQGGCEADYVAWALQMPGCTRAWAFPEYMGPGTVGLAFVRDDDPVTILPTVAQREEMRAYLIEHVDPGSGLTVGTPVGASGGVFVADVSFISINLQLGIYPNTAAIRAAVEVEIEGMIESEGGAGETIYLSDIVVAACNALDVVACRVVSPTDDIGIPQNRIGVMGTITFVDY